MRRWSVIYVRVEADVRCSSVVYGFEDGESVSFGVGKEREGSLAGCVLWAKNASSARALDAEECLIEISHANVGVGTVQLTRQCAAEDAQTKMTTRACP